MPDDGWSDASSDEEDTVILPRLGMEEQPSSGWAASQALGNGGNGVHAFSHPDRTEMPPYLGDEAVVPQRQEEGRPMLPLEPAG